MEAGRPDPGMRYTGPLDPRASDARLHTETPGSRPPHETRTRALTPAMQAVMQVAGRAVAARVQEGGARPRAAANPDLQARAAPAAAAASGAAAASSTASSAAAPQDAAAELHGGGGGLIDTALGGPRQRPVQGGAGASPGRQDGGNERESGQGGQSRPSAGDGATDRRAAPGTPASQEHIALAVLTRSTAAKDMSIEAALRREYDTELAGLKQRRGERHSELRNDMQGAVLRHDHASMRMLRELLHQLDSDFNALETALRQRISDAWVAQAPVTAKAPRPGARTPAEQREVNELLQVLRMKRGEARKALQDMVRSACLRRASGSMGLLMEWYRNIEDELLEQELNPVTTRQREASAQFEQALAQRDHARLLLNQNIRAACEADPATALGLLVELRQAIEEYHHGRLSLLERH
jgi:hypothetical protein